MFNHRFNGNIWNASWQLSGSPFMTIDCRGQPSSLLEPLVFGAILLWLVQSKNMKFLMALAQLKTMKNSHNLISISYEQTRNYVSPALWRRLEITSSTLWRRLEVFPPFGEGQELRQTTLWRWLGITSIHPLEMARNYVSPPFGRVLKLYNTIFLGYLPFL